MLTRLLFATLLVAASTFRSRAEDADPLEVAIGERLFLETRFAQFFAANSGVDANATLAVGDPVMDTTKTIESPQPGPFAGQSMNRRACHLVDEHNAALGNRTYADFARRSPVPDRGDGHTTTPRNSPSLVNASLRRPGGMRLHFDGEFASGRELAIGTFTGRNFGWLPAERLPAIAHIGRIIRDDDGTGALARGSGGAYRTVLKGTDPNLHAKLRLPPAFRIDVMKSTDREILLTIGNLVQAYLDSLQFARTPSGIYVGSPFDLFL